MGVLFKLDFRAAFRRVARAEIDAFANAVANLLRPKVGGRAGGTLVDEILKMKPRIKRWGYVLPYWEFGQKLWWLIHGATRSRSGTGTTGKIRNTGSVQPARPIEDRSAEFADTLAENVEARAAELFARADAALVA